MRGGIVHRASSVHPPKPLAVRAGLARTFGGLAGFLVVTFLCVGLYILEDAFANPLAAGTAAVIGAAFIIALAAMLLFYLIKPRNGPRMEGHNRALSSKTPAVTHGVDSAAAATRRNNSGNTLAYQRFYVDHSRIRK